MPAGNRDGSVASARKAVELLEPALLQRTGLVSTLTGIVARIRRSTELDVVEEVGDFLQSHIGIAECVTTPRSRLRFCSQGRQLDFNCTGVFSILVLRWMLVSFGHKLGIGCRLVFIRLGSIAAQDSEDGLHWPAP